ncbi:type IV secretion system protein TraC [Sphingomonas sp. CCH18-B1]|jgi:conjugal transfer ATP-binding protein TraC|uniref:type IV secretion system protein TraC n=1 Tax=Sphingomonas sp. CCH18-B1 TaxID=1768744 RepID=UPI00082E0EB1|nr:type IV secretion system protein TraC [Sphingomonas sp. CCH18-B1]
MATASQPARKSWFARLFGDEHAPDEGTPGHGAPMLAQWLPYRSFDPKTEIFYQTDSIAFALEVAPLTGADERTGEILAQFLSEAMPPCSRLQILSFQSPRVGQTIARYALPRYAAGGVHKKIAEHRSRMLGHGAWNSLAQDGPFHVRQHRCILSVSFKLGKGSVEELITVRDSITSLLQSINVDVSRYSPVDLIALIDDLTAPAFDVSDHVEDYCELDPIADQCMRRDVQTVVQPDRILVSCEPLRAVTTLGGETEFEEIRPDTFDYRFFSVRNLPTRWAPWDCQKVIGDMFADKLRPGCPTMTSLCIVYQDEEAASSKAGYKFMRTSSLADTPSARLLPQLKDQSREWEHVTQELRLGRKLVQVYYTVGIMSPKGKGDANERTIKSIYKAAGWDLLDERFLQIMAFMSCLPMTLGNGLDVDLKRMKRLRTMLTTTAANLAPLQGEFLGGAKPHLMFIGRRGQPFFWSPFENSAGNHNVAVFGKSGSGKSVALQELCAAFAGIGARIIVIDDGRSFEHMSKMLGGKFVEFRLRDGFSLNPFSMIDAELIDSDEDYLVDALAMLKSIIGQMARHVDHLNDTERGLIDNAVGQAWHAKGREGSIDDVIEVLVAHGSLAAEDLATAMFPFSSKGTYGRFFMGEATVDMSSDFTVFELSDLSSREELRSVVLTAIMFLSSQTMRKIDREIPKALLIDEAWQMLRGGSMADFVETYSRTCRKYGASLITATQSLNDYYKSEGSLAALENSDWSVILQQKPETIADFQKHGRFDMDAYTEALLRSLKRSGTDYSDVMIKGPDTLAVGRLVLDPYSATLYSSSPAVFGRIERLMEQGYTMDEAIEMVAFPHLEREMMREAAE